MPSSLVPLLAGLLLAIAAPAHAQGSQPIPAAVPLQFESWRAASLPGASVDLALGHLAAPSRHRTRRALVGGVIGAAAGVVLCTTVSTLANDSADGGLSFCPLDSYLLIGGVGFALGAALGWVT